MSLFDSFYMTLNTISTVGFFEITPLTQAGRIITVVIIVSGISLLTCTLRQIAQIFIKCDLRKLLGRLSVRSLLTAEGLKPESFCPVVGG